VRKEGNHQRPEATEKVVVVADRYSVKPGSLMHSVIQMDKSEYERYRLRAKTR